MAAGGVCPAHSTAHALQGSLARRGCLFWKLYFTHGHFPYHWDPVFLCVPPPLFPSLLPQRPTQGSQVVETCHNSTGGRNMSEGTGGRQGCGLRCTVVVKVRSSWRVSELKTMPTSFSFPLAGMKQRSCSSMPCSSTQLCSLDMCVQQVQSFIDSQAVFCFMCLSVMETSVICYFGW